ncbi:MAG: hypothetical protein ACKPKO_57030, partial [Candidatus Fonsibacter sp.]
TKNKTHHVLSLSLISLSALVDHLSLSLAAAASWCKKGRGTYPSEGTQGSDAPGRGYGMGDVQIGTRKQTKACNVCATCMYPCTYDAYPVTMVSMSSQRQMTDFRFYRDNDKAWCVFLFVLLAGISVTVAICPQSLKLHGISAHRPFNRENQA